MAGEIIKERRPPLIKRLREAVKSSDEFLKPMLICRNKMLADYANAWFQGGEGGRMMPLNLLDRAVTILCSLLVGSNPRGFVKNKKNSSPNAKLFAQSLQFTLDDLINEIKLAQYTLRPCVRDSVFGLGIAVTNVMKSHTVELGGYLHDYGQPYCDIVDMSDYICDRNARNRQEMHFEGYRCRLPIQFVAESGIFKNYDKLRPNLRLYGQDTKPEEISKGQKINKSENEIFPTVEFANIWLPESNMIVGIPPEGQGDRYLYEVEWDGPETGPIDVLGYKFFPDTIIPIPPAYTWLSMNTTINKMVNKMRAMCEGEKTVAVGDLTNPIDKQLIKDAKHGDFILLQGGADTVKEVTFGGWNAQSFPFLTFLLNQWSQSGPNLNLIGGREKMASTVGQEQMLESRALQEIDDMIMQVYDFTRNIMKKLAHFLITDPVRTRTFNNELAGISFPLEFHSSKAEGVLDDYEIDIEPYSLARMNPEMRYQRILQMINQIVIPLTPFAVQQGSYPVVDEIVKDASDYLDVDTSRWWKRGTPEVSPNAGYQQLAGTAIKSGQNNQGALGQMEASKMSNLAQQQARAPQQTSAEKR